MTIEFDGHVTAMSRSPTLDVRLELRVEGVRSLPNLFVDATNEEVAHYKIGMPVKIQIRPGSTPSGGTEHG